MRFETITFFVSKEMTALTTNIDKNKERLVDLYSVLFHLRIYDTKPFLFDHTVVNLQILSD